MGNLEGPGLHKLSTVRDEFNISNEPTMPETDPWFIHIEVIFT